jgi:hypothetical protein
MLAKDPCLSQFLFMRPFDLDYGFWYSGFSLAWLVQSVAWVTIGAATRLQECALVLHLGVAQLFQVGSQGVY